MANEKQHSALPWSVDSQGYDKGTHIYRILGHPEGENPPEVIAAYMTERNARFIVRAANSFYKLYSVVKEVFGMRG